MSKTGELVRRRNAGGQVLVEFAIMLIVALLLTMVLAILGRAIARDGERMGATVRYSVP